MRRSEKEISEKSELEAILKNEQVCRIAMFDESYPYIVPLNYGYKDGSLFFHCAKVGKKVDLLLKNGNVGFEIDANYKLVKDEVSCKWGAKFTSIIGSGKIEFLQDYDEKVKGLDILMASHGSKNHIFSKKMVDAVCVLRLDILRMTGKQC